MAPLQKIVSIDINKSEIIPSRHRVIFSRQVNEGFVSHINII